MGFTYDYNDFLNMISRKYSEMKNDSKYNDRNTYWKMYSVREAYGFVADYINTHNVENPRTLMEAIEHQISYSKKIGGDETSVLLKKYITELESLLREVKKIVKKEENPQTQKGFKTATYGRKGRRDSITQLEDSVRKMF